MTVRAFPPPPVPLPPLLVVGGRQRADAHFQDEWHQYREGRILRLDPVSGEVETVVRYTSPPEACPPTAPSVVFKSATLSGDHLYVCTQTEVLIYRLPGFERVGYLTLPFFNDLHHVRPRASGSLLVAVTGLDLVAEIDHGGELLAAWSTVGEADPWARFDRTVDYRRVATTKPHRAHPNFVFEHGEEIWVSRFEQRDAVTLGESQGRIAIDVERPHDGFLRGHRAMFSTVDGHLVIADLQRRSVERVVDLNRLSGEDRALGWCRGVRPVDDDLVLVGFSRLRPSRIRENLRWVKHRMGKRATAGDLPTRVALYDLAAGRLLWQANLEEHGLNALFSIHGEGWDDLDG
ncbi:MAG: hypothetical protein KDD11_09170 [Acidobacteria bacterium]|nr:hypothetical protein [Acidobacteriota bacterium]